MGGSGRFLDSERARTSSRAFRRARVRKSSAASRRIQGWVVIPCTQRRRRPAPESGICNKTLSRRRALEFSRVAVALARTSPDHSDACRLSSSTDSRAARTSAPKQVSAGPVDVRDRRVSERVEGVEPIESKSSPATSEKRTGLGAADAGAGLGAEERIVRLQSFPTSRGLCRRP